MNRMLPHAFQTLIRHLSSLPSVGPKMAERLALFLFKRDKEEIRAFADAVSALASLSSCSRCHSVSEGDVCAVCRDSKRDASVICVVEDALDALAIERTGVFHGLYHVLGGVIETGKNGSDNQSSLTIDHLLSRLREEGAEEVILATNPTAEGDLTALYLRRQISRLGNVRISRIARGLATGGDIEYADEQTLFGAIENRKKYE